MMQRRIASAVRALRWNSTTPGRCARRGLVVAARPERVLPLTSLRPLPRCAFSTTKGNSAQPQTADAVMENLNDLYATAKDEFEMAAEETEKKTIYAADDREGAKEAFDLLKDAYEQAVRECDPETAKEVQRRTGPRIKELENALAAVEAMAMED